LDVSDSSISRIAGIESDWIGVGISQPVRLVTSSKSFDRPRGSKLSASESELDDAFVEIMMLRSDSCRDARGDGANENAYEPLCTDAMIITAVVSCSRDNLMMTVGFSAVDYLLPVLTVSQCGAVLWLMVGSHVVEVMMVGCLPQKLEWEMAGRCGYRDKSENKMGTQAKSLALLLLPMPLSLRVVAYGLGWRKFVSSYLALALPTVLLHRCC